MVIAGPYHLALLLALAVVMAVNFHDLWRYFTDRDPLDPSPLRRYASRPAATVPKPAEPPAPERLTRRRRD